MKTIALFSAVILIAAALGMPAAPSDKTLPGGASGNAPLRPSGKTALVPLHYISAAAALVAVHQKMEPAATEAIATADLKQNVLTLDGDHALAGKVREFLAALDHPPQQVRVVGTITRHTYATPSKPAHDEIQHPTILGLVDKPLEITIPDDHGTTRFEFRVSLPQNSSTP